jgi:glutathione S-transferase
MAGGPSVRLYRAEWSTNCERVGLALAHKGIEAQSVLIEYANRVPVEAISGQPLVPVIEDSEIETELERERPHRPRVDELGAEMRERLDLFERLLDGRDYLFGEFGAADCVAYAFLKYAAGRDPADDELFHVILDERQPLGDSHPNLRAWIERMSCRPRAYP